jgi:uncharacterized protein YegL
VTDTTQTHEQGPKRDDLHVAFVLDESGSMHPLTPSVVGGVDDFLEELRAAAGDTYFSLTLFDTEFRQVHLATPLEHVPSLATTGYRPRGRTALLDAIAHTVISTDERLAGAGRGDEKVLVVVLTDGCENSSRQHTVSSLAKLISRYQARPNWTFVFLGAAHDTVEDVRDYAELLSFGRENAMRFSPDAPSVRKSMHAVGKAAGRRRSAVSMKSKRFLEEAGQSEADYREDAGGR